MMGFGKDFKQSSMHFLKWLRLNKKLEELHYTLIYGHQEKMYQMHMSHSKPTH